MASDPLQFPPSDHGFLLDIPLELEFPESLVEELGLEGDDFDFDFDFDLDDLILPLDGDLGLSENGVPPSWPNSSDSEHSNSNPVVSRADACDRSRLGISAAESHPSTSDYGGLSEAVVFKSENASPSRESNCSSEGSISAGFDDELQHEALRAGNVTSSSQGLSHNGGDRSIIDAAESGSPAESEASRSVAKRKREKGGDLVLRSGVKFQRSDCFVEADSSTLLRQVHEGEDKRTARLMRNRESAQLSRQRKKHYVGELENKVRSMSSTIAELNNRISCITAENASLRQHLASSFPQASAHQPPQIAPACFPWIPYPSYALNPQKGFAFPPGSQVPLLPIPRLKTQQPVSLPKVKKLSSKASEGAKKSGKGSKKVASVTFLCFLLILVYCGGLSSVFNFMYGRNGDNVGSRLDYVDSDFESRLRERVLTDVGYVNGTESQRYLDRGMQSGRVRLDPWRLGKECSSLPFSGSDRHLYGNTSDSLVASLYVPRNDKLVQIDGQLIIQSVIASERSVESLKSKSSEAVENRAVSVDLETGKNGLAKLKDVQRTLSVPLTGKEIDTLSNFYKGPAERQRALASSSGDNLVDSHNTASAFDGPLQQWFREGIAGPILRSGMCTEVFRFEVSATTTKNQTTIIPSGSSRAANSSTNHECANHTSSDMIKKNRRLLYPTAIPLPGKTLHNITANYSKSTNREATFTGTDSVSSSMVVSVLLDPRDTGDSSNVLSSQKSFSRILVVVLVDSVNYVTYSCMLPFKSSSPYL